jgi:hypothetical protein
MIGGFHVAALVRHQKLKEAEQLLVALAKANEQSANGSWGFNEWMHGETGHPMGFDQQAWSAAMYLYAEHAIQTGKLLMFDELVEAKPEAAKASEITEFEMRSGGGPV